MERARLHTHEVTRFEKKLGCRSGNVYSGWFNGALCAMKAVNVQRVHPNYREAVRLFEKEISRMCDTLAPCERVCRCLGWLEERDTIKGSSFYIVHDYFASSLEALSGTSLSLLQLVDISLQLAEALKETHTRAKVPHGNIKPSNVLLSENGSLVITDISFGSLHKAWGLSGNPNYIAPEQLQTHRGEVTLQSDIWSFAATVVHLASGRIPFDGMSVVEICEQHAREQPVTLQGVPRELQRILQQCFNQSPEKRPSATELVAHLLALQQHIKFTLQEQGPYHFYISARPDSLTAKHLAHLLSECKMATTGEPVRVCFQPSCFLNDDGRTWFASGMNKSLFVVPILSERTSNSETPSSSNPTKKSKTKHVQDKRITHGDEDTLLLEWHAAIELQICGVVRGIIPVVEDLTGGVFRPEKLFRNGSSEHRMQLLQKSLCDRVVVRRRSVWDVCESIVSFGGETYCPEKNLEAIAQTFIEILDAYSDYMGVNPNNINNSFTDSTVKPSTSPGDNTENPPPLNFLEFTFNQAESKPGIVEREYENANDLPEPKGTSGVEHGYTLFTEYAVLSLSKGVTTSPTIHAPQPQTEEEPEEEEIVETSDNKYAGSIPINFPTAPSPYTLTPATSTHTTTTTTTSGRITTSSTVSNDTLSAYEEGSVESTRTYVYDSTNSVCSITNESVHSAVSANSTTSTCVEVGPHAPTSSTPFDSEQELTPSRLSLPGPASVPYQSTPHMLSPTPPIPAGGCSPTSASPNSPRGWSPTKQRERPKSPVPGAPNQQILPTVSSIRIPPPPPSNSKSTQNNKPRGLSTPTPTPPSPSSLPNLQTSSSPSAESPRIDYTLPVTQTARPQSTSQPPSPVHSPTTQQSPTQQTAGSASPVSHQTVPTCSPTQHQTAGSSPTHNLHYEGSCNTATAVPASPPSREPSPHCAAQTTSSLKQASPTTPPPVPISEPRMFYCSPVTVSPPSCDYNTANELEKNEFNTSFCSRNNSPARCTSPVFPSTPNNPRCSSPPEMSASLFAPIVCGPDTPRSGDRTTPVHLCSSPPSPTPADIRFTPPPLSQRAGSVSPSRSPSHQLPTAGSSPTAQKLQQEQYPSQDHQRAPQLQQHQTSPPDQYYFPGRFSSSPVQKQDGRFTHGSPSGPNVSYEENLPPSPRRFSCSPQQMSSSPTQQQTTFSHQQDNNFNKFSPRTQPTTQNTTGPQLPPDNYNYVQSPRSPPTPRNTAHSHQESAADNSALGQPRLVDHFGYPYEEHNQTRGGGEITPRLYQENLAQFSRTNQPTQQQPQTPCQPQQQQPQTPRQQQQQQPQTPRQPQQQHPQTPRQHNLDNNVSSGVGQGEGVGSKLSQHDHTLCQTPQQNPQQMPPSYQQPAQPQPQPVQQQRPLSPPTPRQVSSSPPPTPRLTASPPPTPQHTQPPTPTSQQQQQQPSQSQYYQCHTPPPFTAQGAQGTRYSSPVSHNMYGQAVSPTTEAEYEAYTSTPLLQSHSGSTVTHQQRQGRPSSPHPNHQPSASFYTTPTQLRTRPGTPQQQPVSGLYQSFNSCSTTDEHTSNTVYQRGKPTTRFPLPANLLSQPSRNKGLQSSPRAVSPMAQTPQSPTSTSTRSGSPQGSSPITNQSPQYTTTPQSSTPTGQQGATRMGNSNSAVPSHYRHSSSSPIARSRTPSPNPQPQQSSNSKMQYPQSLLHRTMMTTPPPAYPAAGSTVSRLHVTANKNNLKSKLPKLKFPNTGPAPGFGSPRCATPPASSKYPKNGVQKSSKSPRGVNIFWPHVNSDGGHPPSPPPLMGSAGFDSM